MATYRVRVLTPWLNEPGRNDMLVALEYPASWTDITWQADELIGADKLNRLVALGEHLTAERVTALQADARFAVLWLAEATGAGEEPVPPADFTPEQIEAVRSEVAAVLSSDVARLVTEDTLSPDAIIEAVKEAVLHPPWQAELAVVVGQVYYYAGNLYEVIQAHMTQSDWPPDRVPALFKRYYEPTDDPWPWVQPLGAHDAYPLGARVTHGGHTWVSLIANNVWEPGAAGSEVLWQCEDCEEEIPEFVQPTGAHNDYNIGDKVRFEGHIYESLINGNVWSPAAYPAGWKLIE